MDALTEWLVDEPVWEHPCNTCILAGYRLRWPGDIGKWNLRAEEARDE
jgi:hypothetical protein